MEKSEYSASISWSNICVSSTQIIGNSDNKILKKCHGSVNPGEFLAILGSSGSGKTTLITCLSNRLEENLTLESGEILINGASIDETKYSKIIGFVPQEDILFTCMTPREILRFSARLNLDIKDDEIEILVNKTINELGLTSCCDTRVKDEKNGLSGGERKRTSIGMELICNPHILFLDEPTTGLDSFTALSIIENLTKIAKNLNRTMIATIHQPNSKIFENFNKMLIISHGRTVYIGEAKDSIDYFASLKYDLPENYNPADFFLLVVTENYLRIPDYPEAKPIEKTYSVNKFSYYKPSFFKVLKLLVWRSSIEQFRNPINVISKYTSILFVSLLFMAIFWDLGDDQIGLTDRTRLAIYLNIVIGSNSIFSVIKTFQMEKLVFLREFKRKSYGILPFFLSFNITIFPIEIIWDILLLSIIYYPLNLNTDSNSMLKSFLVVGIVGTSLSGWGMLISIISTDFESTSAITFVIILSFSLSTGGLFSYGSLPDWYFYKWISAYFFTNQAFSSAQFSGLSSNSGSYLSSLNFPESYEQSIFLTLVQMIGIRLVALAALKLSFDPKYKRIVSNLRKKDSVLS